MSYTNKPGEGFSQFELQLLFDNKELLKIFSTLDSFTYNGVTYRVESNGMDTKQYLRVIK